MKNHANIAADQRMPTTLAVATFRSRNRRRGISGSRTRASIARNSARSTAAAPRNPMKEEDTAFHAGVLVNPTWTLLRPGVNPNSYTIGVEHEGKPDDLW